METGEGRDVASAAEANAAGGVGPQPSGSGSQGAPCVANQAGSSDAASVSSGHRDGDRDGDGERIGVVRIPGDPRQRRFCGVRRGAIGTGLDTTRKRLRLDSRLESIHYQEIAHMNYQMHPDAKFYFEQIKGYVMEPDDDWESMIETHAKVVLNPEHEYIIDRVVNIRSLCYIVGNGARVVIKCEEPFGFVVHRRSFNTVQIRGMWVVTFDEIIFERHVDKPGGCIVAGPDVLINSCNFLGALRTAVECQGGGNIRGCHFFACFKAIIFASNFRGKVRACYFERCLMGIISKSHVAVSNCTSQATYCFLYVFGTARIYHCSIINPYSLYDTQPIEMLSCYRNNLVPLGTIHCVRNTNVAFPSIFNTTMVRSRLYLGSRHEVFKPVSCAFHYSTVVVEADAFPNVKLAHIHNQTMSVIKFMESSPNPDPEAPQRLCLCGDRHPDPILHQIEMSGYGCEFHQSCSCDNPFYSSDEDW